jgi:hypothetical protein
MVLRVAMSGRWSYAALNPDPGKQRGRGQEMVCNSAVALSDHVERFGQAISRVCTINMCAHMGPRIVEWTQRTTTKVSFPLRSPKATRRRRRE